MTRLLGSPRVLLKEKRGATHIDTQYDTIYNHHHHHHHHIENFYFNFLCLWRVYEERVKKKKKKKKTIPLYLQKKTVRMC
jgi:hypothetical protein